MSGTWKGPELWERAKTIIPGGGQLLSKRSERFLPGLWPAYYRKAKGCDIWDLDGRRFKDFAQMGVGTCVLGYADDDVNAAVIKAVQDGSMGTLNCPEEVELAERLIALHPWADMVRFSRCGGEACSIAIRIARAASARSKVAFCGYHGWHDWYLAANIGDTSSLDGQLLAGLEPAGVPGELRGTALPFRYNRIDDLEKLISEHGKDIGVIIMEPRRSEAPALGFLEGVRKLADQIGAVLIFDEVTSGFRVNLGGIHLTYGVEPDIAVFGKALGNGYPISAVVGRRSVMDSAQDSFISSTFWTERIGPVAALATLKKMEDNDVQAQLVDYGVRIIEGWRCLGETHCLPVEISGIPPLAHITFKVDSPLDAQTLYAQSMLIQGYLVGAAVYSSVAYSNEVIDGFLKASGSAFSSIKQSVEKGNFDCSINVETIHAGFSRLA